MKKIVLVILIFALAISMMSCQKKMGIAEEHYTNYDGIYITIDSIDDSEKHPVLNVMWHNETEMTAVFGMGYFIERFDDGEWVDVMAKDFAVIEIACMLDGGENGTQRYKTEYFNLMKSATYRIRTEFYVHTDEESFVGSTYATFDVSYEF